MLLFRLFIMDGPTLYGHFQGGASVLLTLGESQRFQITFPTSNRDTFNVNVATPCRLSLIRIDYNPKSQ
jgi:hypothetical protein